MILLVVVENDNQKNNDMAKELFSLMKGQVPKVRRPTMSLVTRHYQKSDAERLIGDSISKYEWTEAAKHYKYPGPLQPCPTMHVTRCRFKVTALDTLMGYAQEHHFQDHAFGDKNVKTTTGVCHQLGAVSTTSSAEYIMKDYARTLFPERFTLEEGGCKKRCKRIGIYCLKNADHDGKCKFTTEDMISASSIARILGTLTKGKMTSRAGLDDEDVMKGSGSIARAIEIYNHLAEALEHSEEEIKETTKSINWILTYHRTSFIAHLARNEKKCCQCISCGLHTKEEPIPCPYRESKDEAHKHEGACRDCEKSFEILDNLITLAESCLRLPKLRSQQEQQIREQRFKEFKVKLETCRQNLVDWRSHIVRKSVEGKFSSSQMHNLKADEAIVIADFKMKILPMYFRETKRQFFGKRGTSCLGVMTITNQEQKANEVTVQMCFLFSDDTLQDSNYVITGKHFVYNEILPPLFPDGSKIKVKWESDGAGAFNSCLCKSLMPYWSEWTGGRVTEVQIRHSVNGDGKSGVDTAFGRMSADMKEYVQNTGKEIVNAESAFTAFTEGAGSGGASAGVLTIDRESALECSRDMPRLRKSHLITLDSDSNQITTYSHSGYGNGIKFSVEKIKANFDKTPTQPQYNVSMRVNAEETKTHSSESHQSRVKKANLYRRDAANDKKKTEHQVIIEAARAKNLFRCDETHPTTMACCSFTTFKEDEMNKHKTSGVHSFPNSNLTDAAIGWATQETSTLRYGTLGNRSSSHYSTHTDIKDGLHNVSDKDAHFKPGCYCKPARKKAERLSEMVKKLLIDMFEEGDAKDGKNKKGKNKWTPQEAEKKLEQMRDKDGLLLFYHGGTHGPVPTVDKIKAIWSRHKARKELLKTSSMNEKELDDWVEDALGDNPIGDNSVGDNATGDNSTDNAVGDNSTDNAAGDNSTENALGINSTGNDAAAAVGKKRGRRVNKKQKVYVLDGDFVEQGGESMIHEIISKLGGKIQTRLSKNVDYIIVGKNPKRTKNMDKDTTVTVMSVQEVKGLIRNEDNN